MSVYCLGHSVNISYRFTNAVQAFSVLFVIALLAIHRPFAFAAVFYKVAVPDKDREGLPGNLFFVKQAIYVVRETPYMYHILHVCAVPP